MRVIVPDFKNMQKWYTISSYYCRTPQKKLKAHKAGAHDPWVYPPKQKNNSAQQRSSPRFSKFSLEATAVCTGTSGDNTAASV